MSDLEYNFSYPGPSLESAWSTTKDALMNFATNPNFLRNLETAFGSDLDLEKATELATVWGTGDFRGLPEIEVRSNSEMNGAMGAFSTETNTIYFSQEYLSGNADNAEVVAAVWLEEIGHFVDSIVNSQDAVGDEGDIFSRLLRGDVLSGLELEFLQSQDDSAVVILDGVEIAIEMNTLSGDGATIEGAIAVPFEEDKFTFTGKAGDIITLGADNRLGGRLSITLLNPDGSELESTYFYSSNPEISRIRLPSNGTYTVIVDGYDSDIGDYTLGLSNLSQDSTTKLSGDGATVNGKIDFIFDEDIFSFEGKAGEIITLGADKRFDGGLSITLLNPDGSELESTTSFYSSNPKISRIRLPSNGTYTVIVDGYNLDIGDYTLGLSNLSQDSTTKLSGDGATVNGKIDFIFDEDTFSFEGKAGDIITLGADKRFDGGLSLTLLNPDGSELESTYFYSSNPEISRIQLPSNGTYTVIVDGEDLDTGKYILGLSNLRQDSATPILEDKATINSSIDFIFDEDIFTFEGKTKDVITLEADNRLGGRLRLTVLYPDGSEFKSTSFTSLDPEISNVQLPGNGTYTVIVDGEYLDIGEYSLSAFGLSNQDPTGTNKADNLQGNRVDNKINGQGGNDTISGGEGNDELNGDVGNDSLDGGRGSDRLIGGDGNDILDGGEDADTLNGGLGNDIYIIDNSKDKIQEKSNSGTDTIQASISINLKDFKNVENIVLTGSKPLKGIGGQGKNQIDGNRSQNQIDGQAGNDTINSGGGNDNILGGSGHDIVNGGTGNDVINGGAGNDTLNGGSGNDNLIGGSGRDELIGRTGNDRLTGNSGNDTLTGGGGKDRFIYDSERRFRTGDFGVDTITDFIVGQDHIVLDKTTFTSLDSRAGNRLSAKDFAILKDNADAATSSAEIVYNSSTGDLFYNANGDVAGFGSGGKFAILTNEPALSRTDFILQN
ncbi:calcium-binding protein [Okeania sp.]|uniref:calcium-binding protein n=1 Tax=Okeania sp. TaxID=3100323 RepID=UPI002B4B73CE|nr:calcium-binding protein [Okeania sp.]MEB3341347.1 calcium-binding protein [Okeania sp.]